MSVEEFANNMIRVVRLGNVPRAPGFPRNGGEEYHRARGRMVEAIVVHQLGGLYHRGLDAVLSYAEHCVAPPLFEGGRVVGGGLGLPGAPHTFFIPFLPEAVDGLYQVYRIWTDDWCTGHTGHGWADRSVSVALGGSLVSRHVPDSAANDRDPDRSQFRVLKSLVMDYLLPRYGLGKNHVLGGFDTGEPQSPGDVYEAWIRSLRGEATTWIDPARLPWLDSEPVRVEPPSDRRSSLKSRSERQEALATLGYRSRDPGLFYRSALQAFQRKEGLVVDGYWGPMTERAVRVALGVLVREDRRR